MDTTASVRILITRSHARRPGSLGRATPRLSSGFQIGNNTHALWHRESGPPQHAARAVPTPHTAQVSHATGEARVWTLRRLLVSAHRHPPPGRALGPWVAVLRGSSVRAALPPRCRYQHAVFVPVYMFGTQNAAHRRRAESPGNATRGHHMIGLKRRGTSSHDSSVRRATLRSPTHGACEYPLGAVALSLPLASLFGARTVVLSGRDRRVASHPDALARLSTSSPPRIRALTCAPSWQGARRPRVAVPSGMV